MKTDKKSLSRHVAMVVVAVLCGSLTLWLITRDDSWEQDRLRENALCVLTLETDASQVSATVTTDAMHEKFHVGMFATEKGQSVSLVITGADGVRGSVTIVAKDQMFGIGTNIPAGEYRMTLSRVAGQGEVEAVIAMDKPEIVTGWQVQSRIILALFALTGIWALLARTFGSGRQRILSAYLFQVLLLVVVLLFTYLLFHEGGHALAQMSFGRFDLSRSDFWGLHGTPRSGGRMGPALQPWQQALISASGPLLPTLMGWILFVLYLTPQSRSIRSGRATLTLYWTALIPMLVLSVVLTIPLFVAGIVTSDGDWNGFINNVPGPKWLVYTLAWAVFSISAVVAWRILPELCKAWKIWTTAFESPH